jgi:hypothetical protein
MSYIVESGASTSRRARRRRALITLGVVALMLFLAFWYAYSYYQGSSGTRATPPAATCTAKPVAPTPGTTTVNVYNATQRNGLAAATAAQVRKRGFKVSTVSNDPLQKTVTGPAEVRYGKSGAGRGALVLALVKGAKAVVDARTDGSVDLVLGNRFSALAPAPKPAPASKVTPKPTGSSSGGC